MKTLREGQTQDLTTAPIPKLIRRIGIPASIGFFFNTMYNIVDTFFGGRISTQALAALSLSFPVFFLIIAFGSGISTGSTALIGSALGEKNRDRARMYGIQAVSFGIVLSVIITLLGYFLSPILFRILGAEDQYLTDALLYMRTIFYGTLFFLINNMLNAVLQAMGDTKSYRNFLIGSCLINIGLDPWFIYGGLGVPAMGIRGIALATVAVQAGGVIYLAFRVKRTGLLSGARLRDFLPKRREFIDIAAQGFPASINMLTVAAGIFVITYYAGRFGQTAVAAYGAAVRVEQIVLLPTIGLNVAALTLSAQNSGAKKFERVRETINTALKYGAVLMAAGGVLVFFLAPFLMTLFTDDPRVIASGKLYLRIDALVLYAYVVLFVHVAALQGMKKPLFALLIGVYRQIIAPIAVFYLLSVAAGMGAKGIWWGVCIITWSAAVIAFFYARQKMKQVLQYNYL
jgi:putative MATE family efflux protein